MSHNRETHCRHTNIKSIPNTRSHTPSPRSYSTCTTAAVQDASPRTGRPRCPGRGWHADRGADALHPSRNPTAKSSCLARLPLPPTAHASAPFAVRSELHPGWCGVRTRSTVTVCGRLCAHAACTGPSALERRCACVSQLLLNPPVRLGRTAKLPQDRLSIARKKHV